MKRLTVWFAISIAGSGCAAVTNPAPSPTGLTRTNLQRADLSTPGREVLQVRVDFAPGFVAPKHKHPGEEIIYVIEGTIEYQVGDDPPATYKAGDVLFVPAETMHTARNVGRDHAAELATYIVEKGKPLSTLADSDVPVRKAAPIEPVANEPPARIVVDPPLAEPLARGRVVIPYRTEHLHVVPVFGAAAVAVSPRVGHLHVSVDGASWVWADASGEPVVISGLPPGPHEVKLEIRTANHQPLGEASVKFTVPEVTARPRAAAAAPAGGQPPAKLVVAPPAAEPLSRGVAFIRYHAEHLHIVPVFGEPALAIAPRVGHVHVKVDDLPWHWADASGNPVIVSGLPPGPHRIRIELVNAAHETIDHEVVEYVVPAARSAHAGHH